MRKIIQTIIFIFLFQNILFSQDTSIVKFFPLRTGNIWVYHCSGSNPNPPCACAINVRIKILNTSVINGKTYYQGQVTIIPYPSFSCDRGPLPFDSLLRIDSLSGKILRYAPGSGCVNNPDELILDSLGARLHDTIRVYCQPPMPYYYYVCNDTGTINIFGSNRQSRLYTLNGFEGGWSRRYVRGIGISNSNLWNLWCPNQTNLLGCVIDGIVYGDTAFISGIHKISNEIPESYQLSQNYPNPFNPTTKIQYQITKNSHVELKVFDATGNQIATIVNEQQTPGTYEAEFDGTNFASGVYFYKITAGDYTQTKKMVLIK